MGSKPGKLGLQPPAGSPFEERRWLFKPTTIQHEHDREFLKGDDWADVRVEPVGDRDGPVHLRLLCALEAQWPTEWASPMSGPEFEVLPPSG
jgi:hypothetical protein